MLCGMSLIATLALLVWKLITGGGPAVPLEQLAGYMVALAAGLIAPVMPLPFAKLERSGVAWVAKLAHRAGNVWSAAYSALGRRCCLRRGARSACNFWPRARCGSAACRWA